MSKEAHDRFIAAVRSYQIAEEKAREFRVDEKAFKMVLFDLDAAIPGLSGRALGHAYGFKAGCHYWISTGRLIKGGEKLLFERLEKGNTRDEDLEDGYAAAIRAREILSGIETPDNIAWIEDLIQKMKPDA